MSAWAGIDEFVAIAQTRNFTQAGKRLGRSTSQLSRDIANLEDRLGQQLFYRTTRHVSLTDAGERFLVLCRRLLEERDEALASMIDDGDKLQGQLRMTCAVAYGEQFVVPLINKLMSENPRLSVEILLTDEIVDIVDNGIDLAVRFGRLRTSGLVATRLASRTRYLCAAPAYLDRHGSPGDLDDLAHHTCLRGTAATWTFSRDDQPYVHRPHGRFRCNSGHAVLRAAVAGLGLCQLPDFYVHRALACGELVEILAGYRPEDEGVWAVYPHRRHVPVKVRTLVETLRAGLVSPEPATGSERDRRQLRDDPAPDAEVRTAVRA